MFDDISLFAHTHSDKENSTNQLQHYCVDQGALKYWLSLGQIIPAYCNDLKMFRGSSIEESWHSMLHRDDDTL